MKRNIHLLRCAGVLLLAAALLSAAGILSAGAENSSPIAERLALTTYRDIPFEGRLSAVDPDGDAVTFRLLDRPVRGMVEIAENGVFRYTPYERKTGRDRFTFIAEDSAGNVSKPAEVSVQIEKPKTDVRYADLAGSATERAALKLAEEGVLIGQQIGQAWYFEPESPVSRSAFLAMAMTAAGTDRLSSVSASGFADDDGIPAWAAGYVATARANGVIRGTETEEGGTIFRPNDPCTRAEAAVIINNLLRIADVSSVSVSESVPVWARQAAVNLTACGLLRVDDSGALSLDRPITRGEAAALLCAAMELLEAREA